METEMADKLKVKMSENKVQNTKHDDDDNLLRSGRHCAYCLKSCPSPVKLCGGCKKRAYCSKECQKIDWAVNGKGQGHKNWCCKYECGEEDVEWEVVPVPGKGLGILAKKFIPAKYRIIVEPVYTDPYAHPGIMDLAPKGASLLSKFETNQLAGDPAVGKEYVGLRISRANHSCKPNAGHNYDEGARVKILFAQRDIHPGEEICFSYRSFSNLHAERPMAGLKDFQAELKANQMLLQTWGFSCPAGCFCKDPNTHKLIIQGRELDLKKEQLADLLQPESALRCARQVLEIQESLGSSWIAKANTHYFAFQVAVMSSRTLPQAGKHIRAVVDIYRAICPYSKDTRRYEYEMKHPETTISYMAEKRFGKLHRV